MFDNVCKFLAENFKDDFANWLFGYPINFTTLKPTELSLEPIRADSLILLKSEQVILHLEFQTDPDAQIPFRMFDYRGRCYRRYPDLEMRQVVIYLRKSNSDLVYQNSFRLTKTYHEFEVIRLWEQSPETFLKFRGLLPFVMLTQINEPTIVLNQVTEAINQINKRNLQNNLVAASAILAGLAWDDQLIKRFFRSEIMKESVIYRQILEEGELKGEIKGKIEGKIEGKTEEKQRTALSLLKRGLSLDLIAEVTELPLANIKSLQKQLNKEQN